MISSAALGVIEWNRLSYPAVQSLCVNHTGLNCLYDWASIRASLRQGSRRLLESCSGGCFVVNKTVPDVYAYLNNTPNAVFIDV